MAELVADCPRCGASKITFDVIASHRVFDRQAYEWQLASEAFCICRHCHVSTTFRLNVRDPQFTPLFKGKGLSAYEGALNSVVGQRGYVSQKDMSGVQAPEHLPGEIEAAFREGATCLAVNCFNAAGAMFRLCVDLATQPLLPLEGDTNGPNARQRRDLGLRIQWLFDNQRLPNALHEVAKCIKEDGNDAAHRGSLSESDAEDLQDFTVILLERLYTEPKRLEEAAARRERRRSPR